MPTVGLIGATFSLTATPAVRFYISADADADAYAFYSEGKRLSAVEGTDGNGRYLEVSAYAYVLGKTITYTVNGEDAGSYHINSYYTDAKTKGNDALVTLVERFAKYCESADDYREFVIGSNK